MKLIAKNDIIKLQEDNGKEIDLGAILNIEVDVGESDVEQILTAKIEVALTDLYIEGHSELFNEDVKLYSICLICGQLECNCEGRNNVRSNLTAGVRRLSDGKAFGLIQRAKAIIIPGEENKILLQRYLVDENSTNPYDVLKINGEPQLTEFK